MKKLVWLLTTILLLSAILAGCGASGDAAAEAQEEITLEVLPDDSAEGSTDDGEVSSEETAETSYEENEDDDFFSEDEAYADYEDDSFSDDSDGSFSYEESDDVWGDGEVEETTGGETPEGLTVDEDGTYSSKDEVALYIHLYGKLPSNYITKKQAEKLGWVASKGNLWDVAPGKSIGGDRFGNYEGLLPDGDYRECDVNYEGGYRGAERLIYGADGSVYYTNDHYKTFTQLY